LSVIIEFSGQLQWKGHFHPAILAGEAPGRISIIQDKIAIWVAHQPVKNEPAVGFFSNTTKIHGCKGLEDYTEAL
jgi:hypothetical protein